MATPPRENLSPAIEFGHDLFLSGRDDDRILATLQSGVFRAELHDVISGLQFSGGESAVVLVAPLNASLPPASETVTFNDGVPALAIDATARNRPQQNGE